MIARKITYPIIALLFLTNCSSENESSTDLESATPAIAAHEFAEGEYIHWEASLEESEVVITAWINKDWNTYSIYNTNLLGPLPTLISFEDAEGYELDGEIIEEGVKTKFDKESNSEIAYFEQYATFKQKVKIDSGKDFVIKGNVNYMICNKTQCLPPADFNFELAVNK